MVDIKYAEVSRPKADLRKLYSIILHYPQINEPSPMAQQLHRQRQDAAVARILARESTDYYGILGLTHEWQRTQRHIRKNYHHFSLRAHPDRNTDPRATTATQLLNSAYERLNTPEKQKQFDALCARRKKADEDKKKDEDQQKEEKKVEEEEQDEEDLAYWHALANTIDLLQTTILSPDKIWDTFYNQIYDEEERNRRRRQHQDQERRERQKQKQQQGEQQQEEPRKRVPTEVALRDQRKKGYIEGFSMFMEELIMERISYDPTTILFLYLLFVVLLLILILDVFILFQVWNDFFLNLRFAKEVSSNLTPPLIIEVLIKVIPAEKIIFHCVLYFLASYIWHTSLQYLRPIAKQIGADFFIVIK